MVALHREDGRSPQRPRLRIVSSRPYELVRSDALPEHTEYRDAGCDLAASCLACPFARCQYDDAGASARQMVADRRDREIAYLRRRYRAPVKLLASTYGLSRRSIFRILREQAALGSGK